MSLTYAVHVERNVGGAMAQEGRVLVPSFWSCSMRSVQGKGRHLPLGD